MKKFKIFLMMFMVSVVTVSVVALSATENFGTIKVSFIRNQVPTENEDVVLHVWGTGTGGSSGTTKYVSKNDSGTVFEFEIKVATDTGDNIGFVPTVAGATGEPSWDRKLSYGGSADLALNPEGVKGSGVKYAVIFENAKANEVAYSSVNPTGYITVLTYYAASYESNLGIHAWGWEHLESAAWGTPLQVFTTIGRSPDGTEIKGTILETETITGAGLLIYAGTDETKKHADHGDIKTDNGDFENIEAGKLFYVAVSNATVYNNQMAEFIGDSFVFKFIPYSKDQNGYDTGTYATNKTNIIAKTSADIVIPKTSSDNTVLTSDQRKTLAGSYFTVHEKGDVAKTVTIKHADFNQFAEAGVKDFVIVLEQELDNTKEYVLKLDGAGQTAEIELDLDTEKPVISLIGASADNVVKVTYGKKFDMKLFPRYKAMDNRDGDITSMVYVPSGKGKLNTAIKGDYEVTLRVEDKWGNVSDLVITFRVE